VIRYEKTNTLCSLNVGISNPRPDPPRQPRASDDSLLGCTVPPPSESASRTLHRVGVPLLPFRRIALPPSSTDHARPGCWRVSREMTSNAGMRRRQGCSPGHRRHQSNLRELSTARTLAVVNCAPACVRPEARSAPSVSARHSPNWDVGGSVWRAAGRCRPRDFSSHAKAHATRVGASARGGV
jgi:hypothetical protein